MSADNTIAVVETTLPPGRRSEALIQGLLELRLAACANRSDLRSVYWWKGSLRDEAEWLVRFKAPAAAAGQLVEELRSRHPYDVPYIAATLETDVDEAYVEWVLDECSGPAGDSSGAPSS
jgi:periplasmic divalent cation tolerance protein